MKNILKMTFFVLAVIHISWTNIDEKNQKSINAATGGTVTIDFTSTTYSGQHAPYHVMAVWIESASGTFVKTLYKAGYNEDGYLYTWINSSLGNTTDATTSATISNHGTHQLIWDCKDKNGSTVIDGDYSVKFEFTEGNSQGPTASINFTKANQNFDIAPANQNNFSAFHLVFATSENAIEEINKKDIQLKLFPQPAKEQLNISSEQRLNETIEISIIGITGELIYRKPFNSIPQKLDISQLDSGVYFIELNSKNYHQVKRFVKL